MSDINFNELVLKHEQLLAEHRTLAQVRDNFVSALNQANSQMEQLYAEVAESLPETRRAYWRVHLGLPVLAHARSHHNFNFATALLLLGAGRRIQRAGWNGKGMWLALVNQWGAQVDVSDAPNLRLLPFIVMKTVDQGLVPWLASQTDLLAGDWQLWEPEPKRESEPQLELSATVVTFPSKENQ